MVLTVYCVHDPCRIGSVGPKQEAKASIDFIPSSAGSSVLLANFNSDKLRNIRGFIDVVVNEWACTKVQDKLAG